MARLRLEGPELCLSGGAQRRLTLYIPQVDDSEVEVGKGPELCLSGGAQRRIQLRLRLAQAIHRHRVQACWDRMSTTMLRVGRILVRHPNGDPYTERQMEKSRECDEWRSPSLNFKKSYQLSISWTDFFALQFMQPTKTAHGYIVLLPNKQLCTRQP